MVFDRAFTTRLPLAVMIAMGIKKWENRSDLPSPPKGICGMSVSKSSSREEYNAFLSWWSCHFLGGILPPPLQWEQVESWRGRMVAVMDYEASDRPGNIARSNEVTDNNAANLIMSEEISLWNEGYRYWWKLSNVKLLDDPYPVRGNVGMWAVE